MDTRSYKTISANKETADKHWILINAEDKVLGRLASKAAMILRGKHKTNYTPHADCGDYVIVINAEKIKLTGNKLTDKVYIHHTGYPGGQRFATPHELLQHKPTAIIEKAIKGMLPKTRLGRELFRHLFVYAGPDHPHEAQKPKELKINGSK